ncbi:rhomboid family intramembrane serine protease [Salipaludibacillus sp. LMS25]|jgi:membrane associated rhomboid family serine protease|uniref:rhomboid family intramembrane serine protease n=1 Tax=Salipaludibacillus sp. LMS25 TaxID=2924031 RepID=UPI0020D1D2FA|nr:rhomboid family intramembrane serine protease [Salipaludibacillus sp. LMS25]UTR13404.1 rhomboid family intramembrane serine protease [Salipaludibacillus sp. LMS25]
MFLRNETFESFIKSYKIVTSLVIIHIFFYIWLYWFPFLGGEEIYALGVGNNILVASGDYWRLITPIFLHGGLTHMLFNSFSLVLFGPALETMLGRVKFVMAYLATGILANIAFYFLGSPGVLHLGASGAIFGLFGIYVYMVLFRKDLINRMNSQLIMTIVAIGVVMTFLNPGVNIIAHLFGLIAGAAIAPLFLNGVSLYTQRRPIHDDDIGFDPNRWAKRRQHKKNLIFYIVGGFAGMVLFFYLVSMFLF